MTNYRMCLCDKRGSEECETCSALPSDYFVVNSGTIPIKINEDGSLTLKQENEKDRRSVRQQRPKGTDKKKNKRK